MSYDGNIQNENFCRNSEQFLQQAPSSTDITMHATSLQQQQQAQQQQQMHMHMHLHPHLQQHQPQYNEFLLNMPHGQPETYSVLPVGHGNFLKVYHCPESPMSAEGNLLINQSYSPPHPPLQTTNHAAYHMPSHHPTPQMFDSYELFSSPSLMPNLQNQSAIGPDLGQTHMQTHQAPMFMMNNSNVVDERASQNCNTNQSTNMIINKLVNNWSPNLTGGTYTQFGSPLPTQMSSPVIQPGDSNDLSTGSPPGQIGTTKTNFSEQLQPLVKPSHNVSDNAAIATATVNPILSNYSKMPQNDLHTFIGSQTETAFNNSLVNNAATHEVKKRIVAEVKPMRMTYSDVLSKVNSNQGSKTQTANNLKNTEGKFAGATTSTTHFRESKSFPEISNASSLRRGLIDESNNFVRGSNKRSPTHDNKENVGNGSKSIKRSSQISSNSTSNNSNNGSAAPSKPLQNPQKSTQKQSVLDSSNTNKKRVSKRELPNDTTKIPKTTTNEKDSNTFYNVAVKRNVNPDTGNKLNSNGLSNNSNNSNNNVRNKQSTRASSSSSSTLNLNAHNGNSSTTSHASNSSRFTRYSSNSAASNTYSYSSKRSRGGLNFSAASYNAASNRNYELAKKLLHTWLQFMLKILTWLYYLLYDIVVLGFSMAYDRLWQAAIVGLAYAKQLHRDLKQNSNKPNVWVKNAWRRFDARFKKNSRLAFWRNFCRKKPPEPQTESFKQGRLPQTGEEAMYSLLNCKGKDAYSILGVPPDSSQEQIRKHYKKIAVLVHPDKNKQAGAEEAFKVLQRAFELIGEPDKRLAYDQSLAEALHAEKAWTELHDLLSQLQTKITEAASTIRCSTCGLRHPRRLIDRPPYAARECATCKIRHAAREGDIWAETSFLGLRWKYLALMEGKVYDITEWANCQKGALAHLEPNSHMVQYRIVRGAQQQQQQHQPQHQSQAHQHHHQQHSPHHNQFGSGMFKHDFPSSEASLDEFLDNLYSGQNPNNSNASAYSGSSRRRNRRN